MEKREKMEKLREIEDGMRIDVEIVKKVKIGVDKKEDIERERKFWRKEGKIWRRKNEE